MLFSTLKINNIEKCPFSYWLNGRWFLQIVDRDSGNLYIQYNPLFPFLIFDLKHIKCGGGLGVGGNIFLTFHAITNISRKKIILGIKNKIFFCLEKQ